MFTYRDTSFCDGTMIFVIEEDQRRKVPRCCHLSERVLNSPDVSRSPATPVNVASLASGRSAGEVGLRRRSPRPDRRARILRGEAEANGNHQEGIRREQA